MNFRMDFNEWFGVISSLLMMVVYFKIKNEFNPIVRLIIWIFNITYVASIDYALAFTPFALYYCGDNESYEIIAAWIHILLYPPFSFLFLYFYEKWKIRGPKLILYFAVWTGISLFWEWICLLSGLIVFTGWKLYYSIPTYPISAWLLLKLYHYIQSQLPSSKQQI